MVNEKYSNHLIPVWINDQHTPLTAWIHFCRDSEWLDVTPAAMLSYWLRLALQFWSFCSFHPQGYNTGFLLILRHFFTLSTLMVYIYHWNSYHTLKLVTGMLYSPHTGQKPRVDNLENGMILLHLPRDPQGAPSTACWWFSGSVKTKFWAQLYWKLWHF